MTTLREEFAEFAKHRSPRLLALALALSVAVRLAVGDFGWRDLVVVAVILGLEPFTEWFVHVVLLHFKPRTVFGRRFDPLLSREHRAHHADPRDRELVFVPFPFLVTSLVVAAAAFPLLLSTPAVGLTAVVTSYAMLATYEWTHYLIHSPYKPKSRYYRSIWRSHRLHHFRNEHYWYGVTINLADHLLRTFPAKDEVPLSPTAKTLGASQTIR